MGIKMIDFGSIELKERNKAKALAESEKSGWGAEPVSFKYSVAKTGTRQIEVKYKVTDENAVDVDGETFTNMHVWDSLYFTEKSAKMTKLKLRGLGYPVNDLIISSDEDIQELAETLNDEYIQLPVRLVTEVEDQDGEYDDGTAKKRARVKFINEAQ